MRWDRVPLSALCANPDDIRCGPFGTQLNKDEFREAGIPLWGIKQVNVGFSIQTKEFLEPKTAKRLSQYELLPGDLVMTRKGTVGNCAVYPSDFEPGIMHSDLLRMRVDPKRCDSSFLVYQLHHSQDVARQLSLISGGAIMPGINVGRLKQLEVIVPPLAEQKRIAAILDAADALRAKRREALAQLDALLQSSFLTLFGDPVSNSKSWEARKFSSLQTNVQIGPFGSLLHKEDYIEGGIPLINPMHILSGKVVVREGQTISEKKAATLEGYRLKNGDVIMGRRGEMGRCAVIGEQEQGMICGTGSLFLRPDSNEFTSLFLFSLMSSEPMKRKLNELAWGVTMPNLNRTMIEDLAVSLPPLPLQQKFAAIVESIERQKTTQRAHLAELDALFAALQHRAFRGEL